MANYRYLGYGITNEQGIATLDHDANGNPIDHSYTGTGAGEIDIVASLDDNTHISERSIQSETYSLWDTLFFDNAIEGNHKTVSTSGSTPASSGLISSIFFVVSAFAALSSFPSNTASANFDATNFIERIASSFPGII